MTAQLSMPPLFLALLIGSISLPAHSAEIPEPVAKTRVTLHVLGKSEGHGSLDSKSFASFSPDGRYFASMGDRADYAFMIHEIGTGQRVFYRKISRGVTFEGGDLRSFVWSPTGRRFAFHSGVDGAEEPRGKSRYSFKVYDSESGRLVSEIRHPSPSIHKFGRITLSGDDRHAFIDLPHTANSGWERGSGEIWELPTQRGEAKKRATLEPSAITRECKNRYFDEALFTRDGKFLLTTVPRGLGLWDLAGNLVRVLPAPILQRAYEGSSSEARLLALAHRHPEVLIGLRSHDQERGSYLWNYQTGETREVEMSTVEPGYGEETVSFSADDLYVIHSLLEQRGNPTSPPNGRTLQPFRSKNTSIYSVHTGKLVQKIAGNGAHPLPDGNTLSVIADDGASRGYAIWKTGTGELLRTYVCKVNRDGGTFTTAITPDGRRLLSTGGCMAARENATVEEVEIDVVTDFSLENIEVALRTSAKLIYRYRRDFLNHLADVIHKLPVVQSASDFRNIQPWMMVLEITHLYTQSVDSPILKENVMPSLDRRLEEYRSTTGIHSIAEIPLTADVRRLVLQLMVVNFLALEEFATTLEDPGRIARLKTLSAVAQASPQDMKAFENLVRAFEESEAWIDRVIANGRTRGNGLILQTLREYLKGNGP